mmetsp:Transcript_53971/g.157538  ORF Transcript_53971/g.157538 Transcript_53971/m.157538 type:complete len:240 (-) Transcript_53971:948-1667(-)
MVAYQPALRRSVWARRRSLHRSRRLRGAPPEFRPHPPFPASALLGRRAAGRPGAPSHIAQHLGPYLWIQDEPLRKLTVVDHAIPIEICVGHDPVDLCLADVPRHSHHHGLQLLAGQLVVSIHVKSAEALHQGLHVQVLHAFEDVCLRPQERPLEGQALQGLAVAVHEPRQHGHLLPQFAAGVSIHICEANFLQSFIARKHSGQLPQREADEVILDTSSRDHDVVEAADDILEDPHRLRH